VGSGYTSEVFKAVNSRGETLCVKVINTHFYNNHLGQELVNNEIAILERLDHANILKFYKKEAKDKLMIVTEYCPDGNLYDYLCKKRTLPEE
jgi:serine/threonine protein kinase